MARRVGDRIDNYTVILNAVDNFVWKAGNYMPADVPLLLANMMLQCGF